MATIERENGGMIMKEYVRVRKKEIKFFGSILVVYHIYRQMDIRKLIRSTCRSGLMCLLITPNRYEDIFV